MSVLAVASAWDRRIRRADLLAGTHGPAASLLTFYARVLRAQKAIYESFTGAGPSGAVERDVRLVAASGGALLQDAIDHGPEPLAAHARTLLDAGEPVMARLLLEHWRTSSDRPFFAKALLQPYGEWLADAAPPPGEPSPHPENRCPRCGGPPQLSILSPAGTSGDGSSRQLQCANCLSLWFFRRVRCPSCGEEDERQLGYFHSPAHDHVRVDACDRCRRYIKSVDLGRLGLAVPLVDEVAAAALDAWACDHGYDKIEMNLLGL
jgi:formate dehydrogenase maturation protein FdhE